jgi:CubicO group peptidase (beta-lactamase class C family)
MTSGLEFEESYKDFTSDVMMMLYASQDAAAYAYNKPLINEPGTNCYYSSGNTNILTYAFKKTLLDKGIDHKIYPYENLFYKLGMKSVILEYDASDTFLGSTGMYATALDWALFGMLYLNDGIWNDERILPAEWVKYSTTRNPDSRKGKHSAHFWVKSVLEKDHENYKYMIKLPDDIFYAAGHYGQYVTVIPSYNLVIVRLGFTKVPDDWNQFEFLLNILNCFKDHAI